MNNGLSDSSIDVIMGCNVSAEGLSATFCESLTKFICGKTNPLVDSTHDILVSTLVLPAQPTQTVATDNITAPKVNHIKHKIVWSEEGIVEYQNLLSKTLPSLQSDYIDIEEPEMASVLFQVTNHILNEAAKHTNKSVELGIPSKPRKPSIPSDITAALQTKGEALKHLNKVSANEATTPSEKEEATVNFKATKAAHQNLIRKHNVSQEIKRDNDLLDLLSKSPKNISEAFKSAKSSESTKVKSLKVGENTYVEDKVADGFFHHVSKLKTLTEITATSFDQFAEDHRHIVEISKSCENIPKISEAKAEALLRKIRPGVTDFFSVSASHYINGGPLTIRHFQFLVNTVLERIELAAIDELNKAHAIILHKGHKKDKALASSYRTISSCPFVSKAVDIYLGDLSKEDWSACQASTQFQGEGMSHELASLLLTIAIQESLSSSKPLFVLLLDAESAFDLVLRQILVRRLFLDSPQDQRVRYWDLRLANRSTFCQWEDSTMGPIRDQLGVEQGGPNSSEFYKLYNNEQLTVAQESGLGTSISGIPVAAVGQADDTALVSNDLHQLQCLLDLSLAYCNKHQVKLSAGKTKLLLFSKQETDYVKYSRQISPLHIGEVPIKFATNAEHVGVIRSVSGNLPHVHQRIVSHKRALGKILSMGMSRRHRANPLASLRAETIFATPVLYSGMASLFMSNSESAILIQHVKETTESLLKLHSKTPEPVVFFLAGRLPGEALLHLKQLTLFSMICHLPGNILHNIAIRLLTYSSQSSKNWFAEIRIICHRYNLPHPLLLLKDPPSRYLLKRLIKTNITDFWQSKLRDHSATLEDKSLKFFKPQFMSLSRPHPMWRGATTSYKVNKSVTVREC